MLTGPYDGEVHKDQCNQKSGQRNDLRQVLAMSVP